MDLASIIAAIGKLPEDQRATARAHFFATPGAPVTKRPPETDSDAEPAPHARCFAHGKPLISLCKDCGEPVCSMCTTCVEHRLVTPLAAVVDAAFPEPPGADEVRALAAQACNSISDKHKDVDNAFKDECKAKTKADKLAKSETNLDSIRAHDIDMLMRMREKLAKARDDTSTKAAKTAFTAARAQLDAETRVDKEIKCCHEMSVKARDIVALKHAVLVKRQGVFARIRFVAALSQIPSDPAGRAALALVKLQLRDEKKLKEEAQQKAKDNAENEAKAEETCRNNKLFGCSEKVDDFFAFDGARTMPEVEAARHAELKTIGPIQVGVPNEIKNLPKMKRKDHPATSLSACGILCVGGRLSSKKLIVIHLPGKHFVEIACEAEWAYGFVHDGELFVAQIDSDMLWHAPVKTVLAGRTDLAEFEQMPLAAKWGISPRLDAAPAGWVAVGVYRNPTQHMVVDLTKSTSRLVDVGQELPFLSGFTGINIPETKWVAGTPSKASFKAMFMVAPDDTSKLIVDKLYWCPTALPSASEPTDLKRALFLDGNAYFFVDAKKWQPKRQVRPFSQSLVRLYRDVFLCWDKFRLAWLVVRIVVP